MTEPLPIPVLTRGAVRLRPYSLDDVDPLVERSLDEQTQRWTMVPLGYTREMGAEYISGYCQPSSERIAWAIELDGRYAGGIDLRVWSTGTDTTAGDVGYAMHPAARGRGAMSAALALAVEHAFDVLGWELVVWQAHVGNVGSYRPAWRTGFPAPQLVPALHEHRGRLVDTWHAVLERSDPRTPSTEWAPTAALLEEQAARARRPG